MSENTDLSFSPDEIEAKKRVNSQKRIRLLAVLLVLTLGARFFIKDPPPPQQVNYEKVEMRYVAGTLNNLSVEQQQSLSPDQYAKLLKAERDSLEQKKQEERLALGSYSPAAAPVENPEDLAAKREEQFIYVYRQRKIEEKRQERQVAKKEVKAKRVAFKSGRYTEADQVMQTPYETTITIGSTMKTRVPNKIVRSVFDNTKEWQEPIPAGHVRIHPAKGITVTLAKQVAKRITILRTTPLDEEI